MKMKRFVVAMAAAAVLAVSAVSMTACGGAPASIDGTTWSITEMSSGGTDMTKLLDSMGGASCKFEDGVVSLEMMGQTQTIGKYTYENGKLKIDGDDISINGDTISYQMGSDKLVMKKK